MPFNERSRLDTSQVEDRRGRGRGTAMAVGGGGLGLVVLVVALLLGVNPGDLANVVGQAQSATTENAGEISNLAEQCQTGADANTRQDCRIVGFVNSIQSYWTDEFARQGSQYILAKTQLFTGSTQAACGYATAAVGPFYCPGDQKVYLDFAFFDELHTRFGAKGGHSPRRTCWLTSTVITCRTSPVRWTRRVARAPRGREARQFRLNSRLTAWPASGRTTPPKPAT